MVFRLKFTSTKALLGLLAFFQLPVFIYRLLHPHHQLSDSAEYLYAASKFADLTWFTSWPNNFLQMEMLSKRLEGYPLFLALGLTIVNHHWFIYALQNLLALFNFYLVLKLADRMGCPERRKHLLLVLWILFLPELVYANLIMSEILFQTFILLAVYAWLQFYFASESQLKTRELVKSNIWLAAATLTKPVMFLFWIPNLCLLIWLSYQNRKNYWVAGLLLPLLVFLHSFNNYRQTGYFHFSAIKEVNLLYYNAQYLMLGLENVDVVDSYINKTRADAACSPTFAARQELMNNRGLAILRRYPLQYLVFHVKGIANFFIDPGRFDLVNFLGPEYVSQGGEGMLFHYSKGGYKAIINYLLNQNLLIFIFLGLTLCANLIALVALPFFALNKNWPLNLRVIVCLPIIYVAVLTGPFGAARFKVPVWPLMVLGVAGAWKKGD